MSALGNNAHVFARLRHRDDWRRFAEELGCEVATVEHPGIAQPLLVARFPEGGSLSVEFTDEAADDEEPRLGAWLELRVDDPEAVTRGLVEAGFRRIEHPGHQHYILAPGGQTFAIVTSG
jgi:hypothetical protein